MAALKRTQLQLTLCICVYVGRSIGYEIEKVRRQGSWQRHSVTAPCFFIANSNDDGTAAHHLCTHSYSRI